jgi:hypothetical protein
VAFGDTIVRHASYGLELVDALTGEALIGRSTVTLREIDLSPPLPASVEPLVFLVNRSRWVVEDLDHDVLFEIAADYYLGEELATGIDLPPVPPPELPGTLVTVTLKPRTGYPFPRALTRAVGAVRVDPSIDPTEPLVPKAQVSITPIYGESPPVDGTVFETSTADDGQYAVWFLPDLAFEPATAVAFDATAVATVVVGGSPMTLTGGVTNQPLVQQAFNGAQTIYLS